MNRRNALGLISLVGITGIAGCCNEPKQSVPQRFPDGKILNHLLYENPKGQVKPVQEPSQPDHLHNKRYLGSTINGSQFRHFSAYRVLAAPDILYNN